MNICRECKHFKASAFNETKFHECTNPICRNPVSGRPQTCVALRKRGATCGTHGQLWEVLSIKTTQPRQRQLFDVKKAA